MLCYASTPTQSPIPQTPPTLSIYLPLCASFRQHQQLLLRFFCSKFIPMFVLVSSFICVIPCAYECAYVGYINSDETLVCLMAQSYSVSCLWSVSLTSSKLCCLFVPTICFISFNNIWKISCISFFEDLISQAFSSCSLYFSFSLSHPFPLFTVFSMCIHVRGNFLFVCVYLHV